MKHTTIIFVIATILFGCKESTEYRVDPRVNQYVENFFMEGEKRGHFFSRNNLIIEVIPGVGEVNKWDGLRHQAYCRVDPETGQILIKIDEQYVDSKNPSVECTVFHELGHGILKRSHKGNGTAPSIMKGQYWTSGYPLFIRDELIDELFANKGF